MVAQSMQELYSLLERLEGQSFAEYQQLCKRSFENKRFCLTFVHIQNSPGAFPASICKISLEISELGGVGSNLATRARKIAVADYLLRSFSQGVTIHARQNRGAQGSGSFQPLSLPPQVLERNIVEFDDQKIHFLFRISLPGCRNNRILGLQAKEMFSKELFQIVEVLEARFAVVEHLHAHCDVVEDMLVLQSQLQQYGLVAFVGDGSILPRKSGTSQEPMGQGAVPFHAPKELAVEVELVNSGHHRGLGILPGVTALIGCAYHGKSTLLNALVKGVYPHIPGDGRERVVTHPEASFICTEDGRAVTGLDISSFINRLPGQVDCKKFSTQDASGTTSEAAFLIESLYAGARLLLFDEDSSATNFLVKDRMIRELLPQDTVTPLVDRVRELYHDYGVSSLMVAGASSDYLKVADHVLAMHEFQPLSMMNKVSRLQILSPQQPNNKLQLVDKRLVCRDNFDPSFYLKRLDKTLPVRIKPLRLQEKILEYGSQQLDLKQLSALVDPDQILAIGFALLYVKEQMSGPLLSPAELAGFLSGMIAKKGLDILCPLQNNSLFFALPRKLELAGAINRMRNLKVDYSG